MKDEYIGDFCIYTPILENPMEKKKENNKKKMGLSSGSYKV